jgi:hypothetical protein
LLYGERFQQAEPPTWVWFSFHESIVKAVLAVHIAVTVWRLFYFILIIWGTFREQNHQLGCGSPSSAHYATLLTTTTYHYSNNGEIKDINMAPEFQH